MADHSIPTRNTLIFGGGSCGKTTAAILYLLNAPLQQGFVDWSCVFIFSTSPQIADRLGLRRSGTSVECNDALQTGRVCFDPYRMFEVNDEEAAFDWFCDFAYQASQGGPGRKLMLADDTWEFSVGRKFSKYLGRVAKLGRFVNLELMMATHRPSNYNVELRAVVTEWIAFNTTERSDFDAVKDYWPGVMGASTLPKFEFLAFNRDTRAEMRAKLPPV